MCYTVRMETTHTLAALASALSDPIRLRILDLLVRGHDDSCQSQPHPEFPQALCPYLDIRVKLGNMAPSKLSYHLKALREAGLVQEHPLGKFSYYTADLEVLAQFLGATKQRYLGDTL